MIRTYMALVSVQFQHDFVDLRPSLPTSDFSFFPAFEQTWGLNKMRVLHSQSIKLISTYLLYQFACTRFLEFSDILSIN